MLPTAAGELEAETHPRSMVIVRSSGHGEIVYFHFRFEPECAAVPGGAQVPFVTTPLAASELKTAVTTGCSESGLVLLEAMSLIGCAPAMMAPSCAACSIFCVWL